MALPKCSIYMMSLNAFVKLWSIFYYHTCLVILFGLKCVVKQPGGGMDHFQLPTKGFAGDYLFKKKLQDLPTNSALSEIFDVLMKINNVLS